MSNQATPASPMEIVLIRHGQSQWNKLDLFTGWTDVDLSEQGVLEAEQAGNALKEANFQFTQVHTSVLKRAIKTAHIVMEHMDLLALPEFKHWQLNERHYGGLQGKNKEQMRKEYGEEQVLQWRRSYQTRPPESTETESVPFYLQNSIKHYPKAESLADTVARVVPFWKQTLAPLVQQGEKLLITAHGNSLRALMMHLCCISEEEILKLNIPTGKPLVLSLDNHLMMKDQRYL